MTLLTTNAGEGSVHRDRELVFTANKRDIDDNQRGLILLSFPFR